MRRARHELKDPGRSATQELPKVEPALRDEPDLDPLVEEMVERLRANLSGLVALDEWGRPVAWRNVVRLAVGPTLARLRDAETSLALVDRVIRLPHSQLGGSATEVQVVGTSVLVARGGEGLPHRYLTTEPPLDRVSTSDTAGAGGMLASPPAPDRESS